MCSVKCYIWLPTPPLRSVRIAAYRTTSFYYAYVNSGARALCYKVEVVPPARWLCNKNIQQQNRSNLEAGVNRSSDTLD